MTVVPRYDGMKVDPSVFGNHDILMREYVDEREIDPRRIIEEKLDQYFRDHPSFFMENDNIGIVVNDGDRPTPTGYVLEYLMDRFPELASKITCLHIATGSHPETSAEQIRKILKGTFELFRDRLNVHRGDLEKNHERICITSRGTDVRIDKKIMDHDLLILINSVEPHYFAGFTGGRKSIMPGMAWNGTIEMNHSFALSGSSAPLALEGNPVHEDMMECIDPFLDERDHLSIQMVQGPGKELTSVEIGDLTGTFERAVESSIEQFSLPVKKRYDIVVSFAMPPMDRTLYQAQKAVENGRPALKEGGVIILAAACRDGIGKRTFWNLLRSSEDPSTVIETIRKGYRLGYHKAARIAELAGNNSLYIVSTLDDDMIPGTFMKPFTSVEEAVKSAREIKGSRTRILVIPDGTMTVPRPPE